MIAELSQLPLLALDIPSMPVLDITRCRVHPVNHETAANMIRTYHYAHRVPQIMVALGMYVDDALAGCITYGIPANRNIQRCCGDEYVKQCIELNRLFVHDWAGTNSDTLASLTTGHTPVN